MGQIFAMAVMLVTLPQGSQAKTQRVAALVTAYCPCKECCGRHADGFTSTGVDARKEGCAVDPRMIPYGRRIRIPGVGWRTADDTGSAMRASARQGIVHIDVRMRSHAQAVKFGVKRVVVQIAEKPASEDRSAGK